ncbi:phosphogluconate dehydrogenase C-terminal domain-containing protein [Curvibacter sp. RS43]|uniref:Phosphogluconate dehydrogenase C-terminal domain-containing protein n=1 Tax=Curvibacter microcysteis TaxID=3026419 RepID=A0ABT5MEM6_9BURK|nr:MULTISPECIES: phosphogluconate dehydrogenase C-terminal domain-containing protein [unclassified Curvibacter]MDD0809858.1 phosphogluconate dehydrogenase C-terminal domain-containing protein [Curvibacter sp. RS43]MDD0815033.1 phosphogluconate dehydrogenase C-terminal domain-containing protein [Curvibacter sp. HBC28]
MNPKIALFGAGGKMGVRLSKNLLNSRFRVAHVEPGAAGQQRLRDELGLSVVSTEDALQGADVVILAVPDNLIGKISHQIEPLLKPGTMVMVLDAAAPFAGHLPQRDDLTYFVAHPCHPPIYNNETTEAARKDYFGGGFAKQSITSALMQGPESAFDLGEELAKTIYAPILNSYRLTVEQMALLEPGLSETVCATLLDVMREAMDETVRRGVPAECARDFLLGHMNILAAVIFKEVPGAFSDACNKAITFGKPRLMRDDWIKVFERDEIAESIRRIT